MITGHYTPTEKQKREYRIRFRVQALPFTSLTMRYIKTLAFEARIRRMERAILKENHSDN